MPLLKTVKEEGKIVGTVQFCSFNCSDDDSERGTVTAHNALVCYIAASAMLLVPNLRLSYPDDVDVYYIDNGNVITKCLSFF